MLNLKRNILIFSLLAFTQIAYSQNLIYYDETWNVTAKEHASFYRMVFYLKSEELYKIEDYYTSDSIQMAGFFHDFQAEVEEGLIRWYYENGNISKEALFKNGELSGFWRTYYQNGQVKQVRDYLNEDDNIDFEIKELYSRDGDTLIFEGEGKYLSKFDNNSSKIEGEVKKGLKVGKWKSWRENGELQYIEYYDEDGNIIHGKSYDLQQNEYLYEALKVKATYENGIKYFYKKVSRDLNYPLEAYNARIEGKVYVSIEIDSDGKLSNSKVISGIGGGCDEEALRVVRKYDKWNPGLQRGQKIKTKVTLPIRFKL